MLLNISPLIKYRDYRLLFIGQVVSFLGSMISYVAIPYQVYELTHDNWLVGMLGAVQLVPVLVFGILGGTFADRLNRRKMLFISEALMSVFIFFLGLNSLREKPSVALIFVLVALFQSVLGFHRPALEALTQKMVQPEDYSAIGALGSFRWSAGAIVGPAIAGVIIAQMGVKAAYFVDFGSFAVALVALMLIKDIPNENKKETSAVQDALEGFRFALSKPELIGTYVIDIVAMVFAYPVALFPSLSQGWGGAKAAGILFSAMAVGSLIMTVLSGWTTQVRYHGRGVVVSATFWAIFMIAVGLSTELWQAVLFLALAGAADMLSGLFRGIIWNQSVPNELRGRLSGIEMISYMSGPLLGNARAGWVAAKFSVPVSITSGGVICTIAVILTALGLPLFWNYRAKS